MYFGYDGTDAADDPSSSPVYSRHCIPSYSSVCTETLPALITDASILSRTTCYSMYPSSTSSMYTLSMNSVHNTPRKNNIYRDYGCPKPLYCNYLFNRIHLCTITCTECKYAAYCYRRSVVCVCLLVTTTSCANTTEPTEMTFGCHSGDPNELCIRWGPNLPRGGAILGASHSPL